MKKIIILIGIYFLCDFSIAYCQKDSTNQNSKSLYLRSGETLKSQAEFFLYKKTPQEDMYLYLLRPEKITNEALPAIVYFTGGGWYSGSVADQIPTAAWFTDHGIISITADYRVKSRHGTSPLECIMDAKSAVRYVRAHAIELGINPNKIIVAGGSAGGHLAITTFLEGGDDPQDDLSISSKPQALVLHNPVLGEGFGMDFFKKNPTLSPMKNINGKVWPPVILSCGTKDNITPYSAALKFYRLMKKEKNSCELITIENAEHSCDWPVSNPNFLPTLEKMFSYLENNKIL